MTPTFTAALGGIAQQPRFFVWRLTWNEAKGKFDKAPCLHPSIPYPGDAADPATWMPYEMACDRVREFTALDAQHRYTLGWYMAPGCGYWFLDIDHCIDAGQWSEMALGWWRRLPGVMLEYSSSATGVHLIGRGVLPPHSKRSAATGAELYTELRAIAFGTSGEAWGCADTAAPSILELAQQHFPPRAEGEAGKWDNGPRADWDGPADDEALLAMAMKSASAASRFGAKATFAQLWLNAPALEQLCGGASERDAALASHLAFWTGCDAPRMERLMRRSALVRPKWDDHRTYLRELTIVSACEKQGNVYRRAPAPAPLPAVIPDIRPQDEVAQETAIELARGATSDVDMMKRVIPAIAALAIPQGLLFRVATEVNNVLNLFGAKMPVSQLRAMLGASVGPRATDIVDVARPAWADNYAYLVAPDLFLERTSGLTMTATALHRMLARLPEVPLDHAGRKMDVARLMYEEWHVTQAHDCAYHAAMPDTYPHQGRVLLNTFNRGSVPVAAADYDPRAMPGITAFYEHLARTTGAAAPHLLHWIAWQVQHMGKKVRWCPLLIGFEGSGKSLIAKALRAMLGVANVSTVDGTTVSNKGGFTDWAEGRAVGIIEEIYISGTQRYEVVNTVKPFISNDEVTIHRKGRTAIEILNGTNWIAFSNHDDAVPLRDDDRRWMVAKTPFATVGELWAAAGATSDTEYFAPMFDSLRDYPESWRLYFERMPIPESFDTFRAPWTQDKANMSASGRDDVEEAARMLLAEGGDKVGYAEWGFSSLHLQQALAIAGAKVQGTSAHHLFTRLGYVCVGRTRSPAGFTRAWARPGSGETNAAQIIKKLT